MDDAKTTIYELMTMVGQVMVERDWEQFHSPKNMAIDIITEASELLEEFRWCSTEESYQTVEQQREQVEAEFADVLMGLLEFARIANIQVTAALARKLDDIKRKYPVEKCKGKTVKYTQL